MPDSHTKSGCVHLNCAGSSLTAEETLQAGVQLCFELCKCGAQLKQRFVLAEP